jgi:signal transduction histidine kinase
MALSKTRWRRLLDTGPGQLALGLLLAALTLGLRFALDPILQNRQPYTPAFGAVALAVWFGGWRAGLVTAVTCQLASNFFFVPPRHQVTVSEVELVGAASYYLIALVIIYLGHRAQTAIEALRNADAEKDQFIATLSHELRNPMAPIVNATRLIERRADLDPATRAATQILSRQTRHMTRLLDDLMDLSRITRQRLELRKAPVELRSVIAHAVEIARGMPGGEAHPIVVRLPEERVEFVADATRLTQIIGNLLNNAIKYTPSGTAITIDVLHEGHDVVIAVRDQGPGIATDVLPKLFTPFAQRKGKHSARDGGLGIGLWLSKRLAVLHGGTLHVRSRRGEGAEFIVRLPAEAAQKR